MKTDTQRVNRLSEYVQGVLNREDGTKLYLKYKDDIEKVTPQEAFEIFFKQIERGLTPREILEILDKVIHVFHLSLSEYRWDKPKKDSFLDTMMKENAGLTNRLEEIKEIIKKRDLKNNKDELLRRVKELQEFNDHYLKKENILFPYLEKKMEKFKGLTIMWSLHDEARASLKETIAVLQQEKPDEIKFNVEIGNLFFILYGLIHKEEKILFPAATEIIGQEEWEDMKDQSFEYEFPFIKRPEKSEKTMKAQVDKLVEDGDNILIKTETGELNLEQILMIFNSLPVDLSFVDENNKVRFFTKPKDRIFPRSPAVIGREVENCHPSESVHVVNEIVEEFRENRRDTAKFWLNMKGRSILIQYFALRNSQGDYKGVLEVSQDITEIKALEGERRLLEWEE